MVSTVILIVLLGAGFYLGWKKGLLSIISGIFGLVLQIYISVHYYRWFADVIDARFHFSEKWALYFAESPFWKKAAAAFFNVMPVAVPASKTETAAPVYWMADLLLCIISFVLLLIVVKLTVRIIALIFTKFLDITFLGAVNRFLGGVLGLVLGAAALAAALWIFGIWAPDGMLGEIYHDLKESWPGFLLMQWLDGEVNWWKQLF